MNVKLHGTKLSDYKHQNLTLDDLIAHIKDNEPFSYSRWGDGEWQCLLGSKRRWNTDGHRYYPALQQRLREVVKSQPSYYMGLQQMGMDVLGKQIYDFVKDLDIVWVNSDIIHSANINGTWNISGKKQRIEFETKYPHMEFRQGISLTQLFKAVKNKNNVLIGNRWLRHFKEFNHQYISVPHVNCWLDRPRIFELACELAETRKHLIFHICASLMTEVLIDELYNKFGQKHTFIDIGSAYDPYVIGENGKRRQIRSYHKYLKI